MSPLINNAAVYASRINGVQLGLKAQASIETNKFLKTSLLWKVAV
jgi:hypothetical protein